MNVIPPQPVVPIRQISHRHSLVVQAFKPARAGLEACTTNSHRRGFTLVEVMISIAIALVLILGIAQIFSMAQKTTGAGTQVLAATETNRGIQQMLLNDARGVTNAIGDSPGLVIVSFPQAAFRNRADQQQDYDGNPQTINDPVTTGSSINQSAVTINDRVHRTDIFGFFARGLFTRGTGDGIASPYSLTSPTTSQEAFIWYGHLALPDDKEVSQWDYQNPWKKTTSGGQFWNPGSGALSSNSNNFFASDWILGRQVILLAPRNGSPEPHILGISTGQNPLWLPVTGASLASDNTTPLYSSRYDLADATIAGYRGALGASNTTWWEGLSGWDITGGNTAPVQTRFDGNPFAHKPGTGATGGGADVQQLSAAIAQLSPIFVRGCTQFIVEFAGDYVQQDATQNGKITAAGSDGQIDYVNIQDPNNPGQYTRQIRWYGFPRNTAGTVNGPTLTDGGVLPVSTVLSLANVSTPMPFERSIVPSLQQPFDATVGSQWLTDANGAKNGLPAVYPQSTGSSTLVPYVCAWGADTDARNLPRPKMIRITVAVDDPTGHLNTQQIYEYVINLP
jgi:prepilin-type N-terminal cleavage/methylation domain-containing protein